MYAKGLAILAILALMQMLDPRDCTLALRRFGRTPAHTGSGRVGRAQRFPVVGRCSRTGSRAVNSGGPDVPSAFEVG